MIPNLDLDLLKTFIAIADTGSFTRAAEDVGRTQSAVSMQVKRLEEVVSRPIFVRDGRQNRLTIDGEKLLDYARRMVKLNDEAVMAFTRPELTGTVRFGTPDDYADRFLPEILARFARTHPLVEVDVECRNSEHLVQLARRGELDISLITSEFGGGATEIVRTEPLVWVVSQRHCPHLQPVLPIAVSQVGCAWRKMTMETLESLERPHRIAYASSNSNAVNAAVLSGLAVGVVPQICVRPDMRVLTEEEGFPSLGEFKIGLVRSPGKSSSPVEALANHIKESLGNLIQQPMLAAE
ncbi:MAG: LysR substrate-binding domain-containing protein [Hyphomicrobiales bacterium]